MSKQVAVALRANHSFVKLGLREADSAPKLDELSCMGVHGLHVVACFGYSSLRD